MSVIKVRFSEAEVRAFLADPLGPVVHLMEELGGRLAVYAKAKVRKRTTTPGFRDDSAAPLSTMDSIEPHTHADGWNIPWEEVSADVIGLFLEKGIKPHFIHSHGTWSLYNKYAKPFENYDNRGYFGRVTWHPGTEPRPFLTEALWSLQDNI